MGIIIDNLKDVNVIFNMYKNDRFLNLKSLINRGLNIYIFFVDYHKEIESSVQMSLPLWVNAITIDNYIVIKRYKFEFYKEIDNFYSVLLHEIVHAFINKISNNKCPTWINEGLAVILSGQYLNMNLRNYDNININELSFEDDLFYEKCCYYTLKLLKNKKLDNLLKDLERGEFYESFNI